ncbi:unnamed protein product [Caenorhabditis auriculariae]|uniref:Uncharacterized protein n=1 Tax=Caenorhabditis auriculariae TaxID=2777116 RepID=A0A8S1HTQ0_9PELO|nr:unnamed protein product [Caenorhabditis auriculariae]
MFRMDKSRSTACRIVSDADVTGGMREKSAKRNEKSAVTHKDGYHIIVVINDIMVGSRLLEVDKRQQKNGLDGCQKALKCATKEDTD